MTPSKKKVLIVDDEVEFRYMVSQVCEAAGYGVEEAEDGLRGLELARASVPDIIVCDVTMPKLDGYGLIRALREDPRTAGIPFIFLTGMSELSDLRKGMQLGADDYLAKPFGQNQLIQAIEVRLKKKEDQDRQYERKLEGIRLSILDSLPHEFRTPLHGILGFAEILKTGANEMQSGEVEEVAMRIQKSALRLRHLLENFLVYAELQTVTDDPKKLEELRRSQADSLRTIAENASREKAGKWGRANDLTVRVEDCRVAMARQHVTKIVEEVVDNAFKFSEAGTPVVVESQRGAEGLAVSIIDAGRGMSPEQIEGLGGFTQFDRKKYEQQGMGIGLAIARRLAEIYGGNLSIGSSLMGGTAVTITLPVVK